MVLQGLISKMGEIAAPVIEAYHDDLNKHDAHVIEAARPGDVFLWAPVRHGTHLIVLGRESGPNVRAAEHYAAVQDAINPPVWYLIGVIENEWAITSCVDHAGVVARWTQRAKLAGATVSELHM
jgi:hypothetical protein